MEGRLEDGMMGLIPGSIWSLLCVLVVMNVHSFNFYKQFHSRQPGIHEQRRSVEGRPKDVKNENRFSFSISRIFVFYQTAGFEKGTFRTPHSVP